MPFVASRDDDGLDLDARRLRHAGVAEVDTSEPYPRVKGMVWLDGSRLKIYDGTAWIPVDGVAEFHYTLVADAVPNIVRSTGVYPTGAGPVTSVTTTYTILASDETILADASGGAFTVTLPTAVGITGKRYSIKKTDSSTNAVTVDGDGAETIDGDANFELALQDEVIGLVSDGTEWWIY